LHFLTTTHTIDAGEFTKTQLELAGLPVPEGNSRRLGGANTTPGADEDDLEHRAAENNDIFGGEGGDTGEGNPRPRSPPIDPFNPNPFAGAAEAEAEEEEEEEELVTTTEMTWTKRLFKIPGFDHDGSTKSVCLMVFDLPGGIISANPTLNQDLMGCEWKFDELGHALDAAVVFEEVCNVRGQGHVVSHAREQLEMEIVNDDTLTRGTDDQLSHTVSFDFPEKANLCLFNPVTHSKQNVVHSKTIPGRRVIAMSAVWRARDEPIFRTVSRRDLSEEEQIARANLLFPGLRNRLNPAAAPNNNGNGGEADLFRRLNERMNQQEQRLRQEHERRLQAERNRIRGNRLFNMTGDQARAMNNDEFQALFNDMATQLGTMVESLKQTMFELKMLWMKRANRNVSKTILWMQHWLG